jgi:KDO2-lipid IV(A) lauroyltransferase
MKIWQLIQFFFIILLSLPIAVLPHTLALKAGEILGLLSFYIWRSKRLIAIENLNAIIKTNPMFLKKIKGKNSSYEIARELFKNLGLSLIEIIKIYYGLGNKIIENVEIKGIHNYEKAKSKNRGVVLFTGHCGNWELMALAFGLKVDKLSVIARRQKNPYINRIIEKIRSIYGNKIIDKKGAITEIFEVLRNNRSVGILADEAVFKKKGYRIDFLGITTGSSKLPALISKKTGATILPAFINREGKKHVITLLPEIKVCKKDDSKFLVENTITIYKYIEDYIKEHPSEWFFLTHRRLKKILCLKN